MEHFPFGDPEAGGENSDFMWSIAAVACGARRCFLADVSGYNDVKKKLIKRHAPWLKSCVDDNGIRWFGPPHLIWDINNAGKISQKMYGEYLGFLTPLPRLYNSGLPMLELHISVDYQSSIIDELIDPRNATVDQINMHIRHIVTSMRFAYGEKLPLDMSLYWIYDVEDNGPSLRPLDPRLECLWDELHLLRGDPQFEDDLLLDSELHEETKKIIQRYGRLYVNLLARKRIEP